MRKDLFGYAKQDIERETDFDYDNKETAIDEEFYDIFEDDHKKRKKHNISKPKTKKKTIPLLISVFLILVIAIGGSFAYVKFFFTAEKFLDNTSQDFNTWIAKMLASDTTVPTEIVNYDLNNSFQITGDLQFTSNVAAYQDFSNLVFNYDAYLDNNKEKLCYDLNVLNGEETMFAAELYGDKKTSYINIPTIYPKAIKFSLEESPFEVTLDASLKVNDYSALLTKYITYITEALKESTITTTNKGLTVIYSYEINDKNSKNVTNKLIDLISADALLKAFMIEQNSENWQESLSNIHNMTISIEVNVITKEIVTFNWETETNNYHGEWQNENKFRITDTVGDYIDIDIYENRLSMASTVNNEIYWQISLERNGDSLKLNYIDPITKLELVDTCTGKEETLTGTLEYDGLKADFKLNGSIEDKTIKYIGNILFDIEGATIGLEFNTDINLDVVVPIKIYDEFVNEENLTETDYNEIANNLNELLNTIPNNPIDDLIFLYFSDENEIYVGDDTIIESTI